MTYEERRKFLNNFRTEMTYPGTNEFVIKHSLIPLLELLLDIKEILQRLEANESNRR